MPKKITLEQIIQNIQQVAKDIGKTPTANEYKKHTLRLRSPQKLHKNYNWSWNFLLKKSLNSVNRASPKEKIICICKNCQNEFLKEFSDFIRSKNHFCSQSCAALYNNLHKKYGYRRSKLEKHLEKLLISNYGNIFKFNCKEIGIELDIFIPKISLAIEINGIVHYEPIYGIDKFNRIKDLDKLKMKICKEKNISLHVIDVRSMKKFTPEGSQKYYKIITDLIDDKNKGV